MQYALCGRSVVTFLIGLSFATTGTHNAISINYENVSCSFYDIFLDVGNDVIVIIVVVFWIPFEDAHTGMNNEIITLVGENLNI